MFSHNLLILDAALILVVSSLFLLPQANQLKAYLFDNKKQNNLSGQTILRLPAQEKLLELENIARTFGSGITSDSLVGLWRFFYVWKQGTDKEDLISSLLLRFFSASLEIKKDDLNQFNITNSIEYGFLSIRFVGAGALKGEQPLLPFFFRFIECKAGTRVIFTRTLEIPQEKNRPFFALISIDENGKWLSARGRGGGLALWVKDSG